MDKQAFTEMALAEMAAVYRLAVFLASRQEADDLVQETYARAFRSMASYRPTEHGMRPWLFKILHNVFYDRMSAEKRRRLALDALRDEQETARRPNPNVAPDGGPAVDWEQVDGRLRTAIDALPLHHKTVFLLSAIDGLRYREIAAIADVPVGTVMSRLSRARASLAAQLSGVAADHGIKHAPNGVTNNGQTNNGETNNGESKNGESTNGTSSNGDHAAGVPSEKGREP